MTKRAWLMFDRTGSTPRDRSTRRPAPDGDGAKCRIATALAATLALAACNNAGKTQTVTSTEPDPLAAELANRAPVELPPMITSEVTMRCTDDSLVHVTFFTGDKQVLVKPAGADRPVRLAAETAGGPYKADGYSLAGTSAKIALTLPGKSELACKN
jgi:hypothetical protein